jgi:hypothetical protein
MSRLVHTLLIAAFLPAFPAAGQTLSCAGQARCAETASFTAAVTDFRTSTRDRYKVITATVRFQNKLSRPLILGFVEGSGVATDDEGNRYQLYGQDAVRAMGIINRQGLDPKFVLEPGQASDARFELTWQARRSDIFGLTYVLELAVREIAPLQGRQYRLGMEHALRFEGLGAPPPPSAAPAAPAAPATAAAALPAAPAPQENLCAGRPRCSHPGPFLAEVQNITGALTGAFPSQRHVLRINVRFQNVSSQPLILGYSVKTSKIIDDLGNEYYWGTAGTYDTSVTGMGAVQSSSANPEFVLQPGESRNATFQLTRYSVGRNPLGSAFVWDFAVEQLEVLPSKQVRSLRQFSLNFQDLAARTPAAAPAGRNAQPQTPADSVRQLKDLFKKKK